jgi:hypothetical protein
MNGLPEMLLVVLVSQPLLDRVALLGSVCRPTACAD